MTAAFIGAVLSQNCHKNVTLFILVLLNYRRVCMTWVTHTAFDMQGDSSQKKVDGTLDVVIWRLLRCISAKNRNFKLLTPVIEAAD